MQCILRMLSVEPNENKHTESKKNVVTRQPKENDKSKQGDRTRVVWYMGDSIVSLSKKN